MNRAPAFMFYADDWLASTKIMLMSPAEEGAYIRLLAIAWNSEDCGLPDDDNQLAILSRLGEGWFKGGSTKLRECFVARSGRLYNNRLLREREKQAEWRKKSSEGGIASARKRSKLRRENALHAGKGASTTLQPPYQPKGNSPSPSPVFRDREKKSTSSCSDAAGTSPSKLVQFQDGKVTGLTDEIVKAWKEAYPAVDIQGETLRAEQWLLANPAKRKKNVYRFLCNWFSRQQEKGGSVSAAPVRERLHSIFDTK